MIKVTTISEIISDTRECIWRKMQPNFITKPTMDKWKESARSYNLGNVTNCLGSIDRKHIES
jgi:hypothetical protein